MTHSERLAAMDRWRRLRDGAQVRFTPNEEFDVDPPACDHCRFVDGALTELLLDIEELVNDLIAVIP